MPLSPGSRLGPYEILAPIGAGGMGEVYRAKDPRLGREVAIKVLPSSFSADADRLRRFEQEAKAAGLLNHPNITAIYDIGQHDGAPYVVQELLEGETLRATLAGGRLSPRKSTDNALQIVNGLAAAHEKGIVHRDLKPENLFVTKDGRVKILDFGLAKLTQQEEAGPATNLPTATAGTEPGVVLGTLGYMSPEQIKGRPADARSDIFSFGAVLYEMLSGKRAFQADSTGETLAAILKDEPPEISESGAKISPGLERIVAHCLEKSPPERFQSARDLGFALQALSVTSSPRERAAPLPEPKGRYGLWLAALLGAAVLAGAGYFAGSGSVRQKPPTFHRLTFRRGIVHAARFSSDLRTVVYAAAWQGGAPEVYSTRIDGIESRPLGLPGSSLLALSRADEIAAARGATRDRASYYTVLSGTLASVPLAGGEPRDLLQSIAFADFGPDGRTLAIVREGGQALEYPPGKVLYRTSGWISNPRVGPQPGEIAFLEHPVIAEPGGDVCVIDSTGRKRTLASRFIRALGLAWSADGQEVWFTASREGTGLALYGVRRSGRERLIYRIPGALILHDVSRDGRVLLAREEVRREIRTRTPGQVEERDASWLDYSNPLNFAADGTLAFLEMGDGGGPGRGIYLRRPDGRPPTLIASGASGMDLSQDGKWMLAVFDSSTLHPRIVLIPTGPGEPRPVETAPLKYSVAYFAGDGKTLFFQASSAGRPERMYVQDIAGGPPRPMTPEGIVSSIVDNAGSAADGETIVVRNEKGDALLWKVDGTSRPIVGFDNANEAVMAFADHGALYVAPNRGLPRIVYRLEPATGQRQRVLDLAPADTTGVSEIDLFVMTPSASAYAYSYIRRSSDLYVVEGLQ